MRCLAPHLRLYSEMLVDQSIIHGPLDHLLAHHRDEFPLALQLASANPETLATAINAVHVHTDSTAIAEINLNVGCPSSRVQAGGFGACLMKDPVLLAELVDAMHQSAKVPISVKMRLGVDERTGYPLLRALLDMLAQHQCHHVILHARSAWLKGLNPKKNRTIPPLDYEMVHRLKAEMPDMRVILNGGLASAEICEQQLQHVDGVMIGRAAFADPWLMARLEKRLFGTPIPTLAKVVQTMMPYWQTQLNAGARPFELFRGTMHLIHGMPGAKRWRSILTEACHANALDIKGLTTMAHDLMLRAAL